MRKTSDPEYQYVEKMRNIVACLLDNLLDGEASKKSCAGRSEEQKFFTCDVCNWQTRFEPALKGHKKRMHLKSQNAIGEIECCDKCDFKTSSKATLMVHKRTNHKGETRKRTKPMFQCNFNSCESTFDCEVKLNDHKKTQHTGSDRIGLETVNLVTLEETSSPPRKKTETQVRTEEDEEVLDLDNLEMKIDKELNNTFLVMKKIRELEV